MWVEDILHSWRKHIYPWNLQSTEAIHDPLSTERRRTQPHTIAGFWWWWLMPREDRGRGRGRCSASTTFCNHLQTFMHFQPFPIISIVTGWRSVLFGRLRDTLVVFVVVSDVTRPGLLQLSSCVTRGDSGQVGNGQFVCCHLCCYNAPLSCPRPPIAVASTPQISSPRLIRPAVTEVLLRLHSVPSLP